MGKKPALASQSLNFSTKSSALASSYFFKVQLRFILKEGLRFRTWFPKNDQASSGFVAFINFFQVIF